MSDTTQYKILFALQPDEDGFPPYSCESVWAIKRDDGRYEVDNIPFFIRDATLGDIIEAAEEDDELWFTHLVTPSLNSLIRVIYFDGDTYETIRQSLEGMGCEVEHFDEICLLSVHIPNEVSLAAVQSYLQKGFHNNLLDYQEAILRQ